MKSNNKGKLIVIEGTDGAGKSSMVRKLVNKLNNYDHKWISYSIPNENTDTYILIRKLLTSTDIPTDILQSLIISNEKEFFKIINKKINDGINVILDRWVISSIIYSINNGGNILYNAYKYLYNNNDCDIRIDLNKYVKNFCGIYPYPDLIFYIDPGEKVLRLNAKLRHSKELNDSIAKVLKARSLFRLFYNNISYGDNYYRGTNPYLYKEIIGKDSVFYSVFDSNGSQLHNYIIPDSTLKTTDEIYNNLEEKILDIITLSGIK